MIEKQAKEMTEEYLKHLNIEEMLELEKEGLTGDQLMARASDAELFYKSYFEKVLKMFTFQELKNMGIMAETAQQVVFYRGVLYSLELIDNWFKQQTQVSQSRFDEEEKIEKGQSIKPQGKL